MGKGLFTCSLAMGKVNIRRGQLYVSHEGRSIKMTCVIGTNKGGETPTYSESITFMFYFIIAEIKNQTDDKKHQ